MTRRNSKHIPQLSKAANTTKAVFRKVYTRLKALRQHLRMIAFILGVVLLCAFMWTVYAPQTIAYDFGQKTACQTSPRLFPSFSKIEQKTPFAMQRQTSFSLGSFAVYSHRLCADATAAPQEKTAAVHHERLFGWTVFGHAIKVQTSDYPKLSGQKSSRTSLPPDGTLKLELDRGDATFSYMVRVGERTASCKAKQTALNCDIAPLQLSYAAQYDLQLVRTFAQKEVSKVTTTPIRTITPTAIVNTSIGAKANVQEKPMELTIQTDKDITALGAVSLVVKNGDGSEVVIPTTATAASKTITVKFGQELPRRVQFELRISSVEASDGSGFAEKSFILPFGTSGGPKVTGANIGVRNVLLGQTFTINLDQELAPGQDIGAHASLIVHGKAEPADFVIAGNKLQIKPKNPLPLCAPFTLKLNANVQSKHGVSGDSSWSLNSRVICYTTFSIGSSVKGRAITAYRFGAGDNPIVYMGAMHGDELNSKSIMTEWFNELAANPNRTPARSIVVIPAVSPDGVAAKSRNNARGIDLNRNFPAADWKTMVTSPESPSPTPAGGPSPLSEPESAAVASYIRQVRPRMVFSFHSSAAIVEANESGDSVAVAQTYAAKARYRAVPKSQSAGVFKYDTTGAMEDWMRTSLGSPAIVVELLSDTSSEFARNRDALWYSTGL